MEIYRDKNGLPKLLGVEETANLLGWSKQKLVTRRNRGQFLEPDKFIGNKMFWVYERILEYQKQIVN